MDGASRTYRPENLRRILPYIAATYGVGKTVPLKRPILVVGWDGVPLDPTNPKCRERVDGLFAEGTIARADLDQRVSDVIAHTPTPAD